MASSISNFTDRFDKDYYEFLLKQLEEKSLLESAIELPRKIGKNFRKAIRIDFCGFSGSVLFNTGRDDDDVHGKLKQKIATRVKELMSDSYLKEYNKKGYYLRFRLILGYVYSDFCLSFMKSEASRNRPKSEETPRYSFEIEGPLLQSQFDASSIRQDQLSTLNKIEILTQEQTLLHVTSRYSNDYINTLQIRFAVTPIPISLLIINNIAISFPYIYALKKNRNSLSFVHPITIVNESMMDHFKCLENHWENIWSSPLTLFNEDTTNYSSVKKKGLASILLPDQLRWNTKKDRIMEELNLIAPGNPPNKKELTLWVQDLKERVRRSTNIPTRDIERVSEVSDKLIEVVKITKLKIGYGKLIKKEEKCYFIMIITNKPETLITLKWDKVENAFAFLLHYAYAKKYNKSPVLEKFNSHYQPDKQTPRKAILRDIFKPIWSHENGKNIKQDHLFRDSTNSSDNYVEKTFELILRSNKIIIIQDGIDLKKNKSGAMMYDTKGHDHSKHILDFSNDKVTSDSFFYSKQ